MSMFTCNDCGRHLNPGDACQCGYTPADIGPPPVPPKRYRPEPPVAAVVLSAEDLERNRRGLAAARQALRTAREGATA